MQGFATYILGTREAILTVHQRSQYQGNLWYDYETEAKNLKTWVSLLQLCVKTQRTQSERAADASRLYMLLRPESPLGRHSKAMQCLHFVLPSPSPVASVLCYFSLLIRKTLPLANLLSCVFSVLQETVV